MRQFLAALVFLGCVIGSTAAHADSYSYGGKGSRFALEVFLLGFNEGAGAGGWDEDSAREFASWASRFDAIIPAGAFVALERDVNDPETTLTIRIGKRVEVRHMPDGPDLDAALALVAKRFRAPLPPARRAKLYTLQLFASRSPQNAERFAESFDARGVSADGQVYHAACHPCAIPESRVLEPTTDGIYRVVTGVYAERRTAERGLQRLRKRAKVRAFVRELQ